MKTKLLLIATLLISTITFSQTSKKGYDYYKASSDTRMNKAELIDALAKDANISKRAARIGRNPQTGKEIKVKAQDHNASRSNTTSSKTAPNSNENNSNTKVIRKRPGRTKYKNSQQ